MKKRVIAIVGPTASGKTALSLQAAQMLGGEILCMDSMQIYRDMDIGTAKPTREELALVPHYLHSFLSPIDSFSVSQYEKMARPLMARIKTPLLVGGTGLYLQSLSLPMDYGAVGGDEAIREKYHRVADEQGTGALHALLEAVDPRSAARLHPNDVRRVVRALEVFELTGVPLSNQKMPDAEDCPYDFQIYALEWERDALYARVNRRVDQMMSEGLLQEVKRLREQGVPESAQSMQGLGYKELRLALDGKMTVPDAVTLIKTRTRHYAKRQLTWFRRDARVQWIPYAPGKPLAPIAERIADEYGKERK
ncbi:MAG: tRNA (adenosine(37)-N6)-dimethylallyltransferase MiaA [Clostridia bacterium]|nr:tRNA (adenosine(37)-N6)-dimethylallyltransferase MiaA [Clostridia bacterium]